MRGSLEAVQSFLSTQIKNIQNALAASGATVNRFFFGTNAEGIENTALRCTGIDNLEKFELETDGPELARQLAQAEATEATTSHKSTIYRPHLTSPDQYAMFVRKAFTKKQTAQSLA